MMEMCDELAGSAKRFGSVNTVLNNEGKLIGHNTDGIGWSRAVKEAFSLDLSGVNILVLGAGGASRAVVIQALSEGCGRVVIANRSRERGEAFAAELGNRGDLVQFVLLSEHKSLRAALKECTLVVNCTSAGLDPTEPPVLTSKDMHPTLRIYDTIYGKGAWKLRDEAHQAGIPWSDGLGMLLHQGAEAFHLWTKLAPPVDEMRYALTTH
jgi:shikimate dehydrogenase